MLSASLISQCVVWHDGVHCESAVDMQAMCRHVTQLNQNATLYAGPMVQCIVWHDGSHWWSALDTQDMYEPNSSQGKLADFKPLTNYKTEQQYGTFSKDNGCNFVCNIYEEGNVLSIVVDSGSHGTHVAGITAAHQPDNPSLNGIAPGGTCPILLFYGVLFTSYYPLHRWSSHL